MACLSYCTRQQEGGGREIFVKGGNRAAGFDLDKIAAKAV